MVLIYLTRSGIDGIVLNLQFVENDLLKVNDDLFKCRESH